MGLGEVVGVDVGGGGGLFVVHVRKVALRLLLIVAGPIVFLGLLEGVLYLTGAFEPLSVVRQVRHKGKMSWTSEPQYARFALQREKGAAAVAQVQKALNAARAKFSEGP